MPPQKKQTKILAVDDEADILFFIQQLLENKSYTVLTALSGQEALEILTNSAIDILVTDIRMPGMDGIELIYQATARTPDLQCIVMTGHGDTEIAISAIKVGANKYMQKPINFEELLIAIENSLEKHEHSVRLTKSEIRPREANINLEKKLPNVPLNFHKQFLN